MEFSNSCAGKIIAKWSINNDQLAIQNIANFVPRSAGLILQFGFIF
jgi:hypothetical protein